MLATKDEIDDMHYKKPEDMLGGDDRHLAQFALLQRHLQPSLESFFLKTSMI